MAVGLLTTVERRSDQPQCDTFKLFHINLIDVIVGKKLKDILGHLVSSVGRIKVGIDGNPNNNRTESFFFNVFSIEDSEEAGGMDEVAPLNGGVNQIINKGTDCVSNPVELECVGLNRQA